MISITFPGIQCYKFATFLQVFKTPLEGFEAHKNLSIQLQSAITYRYQISEYKF